MKKLLVIVLALAMVFTMFACGEKEPEFTYPEKPVTIICPYAISGGTGTMCNIMGDFLSKRWGVSVNVVEKSGGSGTVGTAEMAFSEPDGYTLMVTAYGAMCVSPATTGTDYKFEDVNPIIQISESYTIISASTDADKYHNWDEFYAAAQAAPGTVTISSSGTFGAHHVAIEVLSIALTGKTGLFLHMPESGGAASCTAVLGGHYDAVAGIVSEQSKYFGLAQDALTCLIQMTDMKAADTNTFATSKEVPTCGDLGINATGGTFYMVCCQKDVPEEIVAFLEKEFTACIQDADVAAKFTASDNPVVYLDRAASQAKYKAQFDGAAEVTKALM